MGHFNWPLTVGQRDIHSEHGTQGSQKGFTTEFEIETAVVQAELIAWELRYSNPVLQIINLNQTEDTATFEILTMSQHNAMTFQFTIK